jgi:hypothetical protein
MSLNHGVITVDLDGEQYELRPSLLAMKKIQARFGGLRGALEAVGQLNVENIALIVAAGCNAKPAQMQDIEQAVYNQGIADATEQVVPFVTALMNPKGSDEPKKHRPE